MTLHVAPNLSLPIEAVTETFGILAKKGAGKSNAAVVMAEEMHKAGVPWVAIDPKGDWWGMRSSRDGQAPGLPLVVFGGRHGDVPLEPTAGALIADLVLEQRLTCIVDVSEFSKADTNRFLLTFADRLYRQAENDPLHLFLEEAHEYLPQRVMRDEARVVGAWQKIVKQGRFKGLGCTLVTQRSASLNKDVLTQVDTLIMLRTTSPQDRAAVKAWIDVHADSDEVIHELPTLKDGEAWVWSPEFLGSLTKVQFRRRETYDSGSTPKVGQSKKPPATLADVDLAAIKEAMAETIERAAQTDPKALKQKIATLERRLREQATVAPEIVEREVVREVVPEQVKLAVAKLVEAIGAAPPPPSDPAPAPAPAPTPPPRRAATPAPAPRALSTGPSDLPGPQRKLLTVLATYGARTKQQLALQAGYSVNGGGFNNPLGAIRSQGFVEPTRGEPMEITEAGLAALGEYDPLPSGPALLDHWLTQLPGPCARILEQIAARWPDGWTKEDLAEAAGYQPTGGGFNNPLGRLRTLGLVTRGTPVMLTDEFGEAIS